MLTEFLSLKLLCFAHLECSFGFFLQRDPEIWRRNYILVLVRLWSNISAMQGEVPTPSRHFMPPAIDQAGSAVWRKETEIFWE
jgi:hypothetical protein